MKTGTIFTGLLAVSIMSSATPTQAQEGVLEEVIVVAQKREENIQDVSIAVTAFSGQEIRDLGLTRNVDIAGQTPSLMFAEGSEQLISVTSIRGVSQTDVSFHLEPPNAIYVDQAYISVLSAGNFQMYDLERVEILRGPQGTLFGRNATGGLLHFLTRAPDAEPSGYADLQIGDYSQVRFEGAIGGGLTDTISGRLSVLSDKYDGFAYNTTLQEDYRDRDESAVRGQLQFDPNDDLSIRLIGSYAEQDTNLGFKHSANGINEDGLLFTLPRDVNFWGTCTGCDPSGHIDSSADPDVSDFDTKGFFKSETTQFTGIVDWHLENMTLTAVSQYFDYQASHLEDGELAPRPGFDLNSGQDSNQFAQEIRLAGDTDNMRWIAGLYFLDRDATSSQDINVNLQYFDDVLSVFGAIPPGFIAGFGTTDNFNSQWTLGTRSTALFGQTEFDIGDSLTLIAGLRWTDDDLDYRFKSVESIDGFPIGPGGLLGETEFMDKRSESDWSGKLGLDWNATDNLLVYGSYSRGTKSGGWNAPFLGGEVTDFGGEDLGSFEAGFKSTLMDSRLRFNATAFYYDYNDYQGFTFVDLAAEVSNLDATITGAEFELYASPGRGWDFGVGLSFLDTEIKDVVLPSGRVTNNEMPLAPDTSFNARVRKSWSALGGLFAVAVDYNWMDEHYSEALNHPSGLMPSYGVTNARFSYLAGDGAWEFALIARNLTDEDILVYRTPITFGFTQDHYGHPRWLSGQIIYHWQ